MVTFRLDWIIHMTSQDSICKMLTNVLIFYCNKLSIQMEALEN